MNIDARGVISEHRAKKLSEMRVLEVTLAALAIAGCWRPASWTSLLRHAMYNAYTTLIISALYAFSVSQVMELVLNIGDADVFGDALFNILISLLACYKAIVIRVNHESVTVLIDELSETPFKPLDPIESTIREKFDKRIANNTFCYLVLVLITSSYMISLSLLTQFKKGELMYRAWIPFDRTVPVLFYFAYVHQMICLIFIGLIHPTSDSLICGLLLHVCCQIEILEYRLSSIANGRGNLRDCVRHHIRIFEYAYILNEKFSKIIPNEFAMVTVVMCYDLVRMAVASSNAVYIQGIMTIACTLAAIFYCCWFGNEIKLKSLQLSDSIFGMEWTILNVNVKKGLLMIMNRSTIPIEFSSSHLLPMNLDSFVMVLKTSYSLFNVLIRSHK